MTKKELKGIDDVHAAGFTPQILEGADAERLVIETVELASTLNGNTGPEERLDQGNPSDQQGDEGTSDQEDPAIAGAMAIANEVTSKVLDGDVGAPFEQRTVRAFALLRIHRPDEFQRVRDRLKKSGVGLRELDPLIRVREQQERDESASGKDTDFGAEEQARRQANQFELPPGVKCPDGYLILNGGVEKAKVTEKGEKWEIIAHEPLFISGRTENLDDGTKGVKLSFGVDGRGVQSRVVNQRVIADGNQLLELSNAGLPVTSLNKSDLVGFLDDQLDASKLTLPSKLTTGRSGWIEVQGQLAFVLGAQVFGSIKGSGQILEFVPANAHAQSILRTTAPKGELSTWIDAVRPLMCFRHFVFGLGAAFGAPLLQPLKVGNLIIHFQGESSRGKTTVTMVAASVYAFPGDSTNANAFIRQWRGTDNAIESLAFAHNGLILILDEVGQAEPDTPKKVIYLVGNGQVKSRADSTGQVRPPKNFSLILLSTGELSLAGNKTTTGQEVRMVEIMKSPFDEDRSDLRAFVDGVRATIHDNYGMAGAFYLQELVNIMNDPVRRKAISDSFGQKHQHLLRWKNSPFHARNAQPFAAMWLGFELANQKLGLIADAAEVERIFVQLYQEAGEKWATDATTVEKAIRYVWDQIDANPERFVSERDVNSHGINLLGTTVTCGGLEGCYALFGAALDKILTEGGFDPKSTKQAFREKGYVVLASDGGLPQVRVPDGKRRPRCYVFHRDRVPHLFQDQTQGSHED